MVHCLIEIRVPNISVTNSCDAIPLNSPISHNSRNYSKWSPLELWGFLRIYYSVKIINNGFEFSHATWAANAISTFYCRLGLKKDVGDL